MQLSVVKTHAVSTFLVLYLRNKLLEFYYMKEVEEKNVVPESVVEQPIDGGAPPSTKREALNKLLAEEIPDYNIDDDESAAEMLMNYINGNREQRNKLAEALQSDPRLAQMLADIVSGKRGAAGSMVRYFGKDFLSAEEGTPEYEEIQAAEEERKREMEAMGASGKEYTQNLEKSMPVVEEWCREKGYVVDEFLEKVWDALIAPVMSGNYSREVCDFLDKGLNYDRDTKDALDAGVVQGRNENIHKMREERGDGLPKGITTTSPSTPKKKEKSPLISAALSLQ